MLQLPEAQLGSNANQHLRDIYSHCQSGTCLFSERCILNRKIKMNRWRWEMMSSRAKHIGKILATGKRGRREVAGGRRAALAGGGAGDRQARRGAAGMQPGCSRDAAGMQPPASGEHRAGRCGDSVGWWRGAQRGSTPPPLAPLRTGCRCRTEAPSVLAAPLGCSRGGSSARGGRTVPSGTGTAAPSSGPRDPRRPRENQRGPP